MSYEEYQFEELEKLAENGLVLIVTATDTETSETHKRLSPVNGYKGILQIYNGAYTYYIGQFGKYNIAHVQCNMGAVARDSSIMTISNAVEAIKPKFVIMIGIAFGINSEKQNIGDVLISEGIVPYDNKRVGEKTIYRGQNAPSSKILLSRFKSIRSWEFILPKDLIADKIFTQILSGEELIDNKERRDELLKSFPNSKGGEMEGAGLYAACDGKVDWILVKGICDFADGNKGDNKKTNQGIAINSALSLCFELFNSDHAFRDLNLNPVGKELIPTCECVCENVDDILFEVYTEENEIYYVNRKDDEGFNEILNHFSIWIHGVSGCGKTNLIIRNLISNSSNYRTISLASCIGLNVKDLFGEVLVELENEFDDKSDESNNDNFSKLSKSILSLLKRNCKEEEMIIFIEEIPISADEDYMDFATHFYALLISKKLIKSLDKVKFVLSSIKDPTTHIPDNQQKIHQQLKFIKLKKWAKADIERLIALICENLNIKLEEGLKVKLIKASSLSPRFIKKFFRNIVACCLSDDINYEEILGETKRELN